MKKILGAIGLGFPSPYGVSFILTNMFQLIFGAEKLMFPSPYGVIFILTNIRPKSKLKKA